MIEQEGIIIEGLENEILITGNPILVRIKGVYQQIPMQKAFIHLVNNSVKAIPPGLQPVKFDFFPNSDGEIIFDLAPMVKAYFSLPDGSDYLGLFNPNLNNFTIHISAYRYDSEEIQIDPIQMKFIRAHFDGYKTNVEMINDTLLLSSEKSPYWNDYAVTANYQKIFEGEIIDTDLYENPQDYFFQKEDVRGCDNTLIRFLNHQGGYSFYLFEKSSRNMTSESGQHTSRNIFNEKTISYNYSGGNQEKEITLNSEVKSIYFDHIADLISSPFVEIYDNSESYWKQIKPLSNSITEDSSRKVFDVSYSFRFFNDLNRKIWQ